ncbi:hypothetical protein [Virgisporangium aurantiacum]|uniref:Uncharacterized protein n=1 Tax=Virgisporangium aurantiacum TaxID=175570 RepID=A0A8J3Z2E8_9ACTN|nr:hypothetical protein [Virgisporangium aurantiacum]GIJ56176.1 hypothetical protein Vau01_036920 [Virgisporangium aurantiacum]
MAALAAEAYRQIASVQRPNNPWLTDAAELLAAFRLAREVASPYYTDAWIMQQIDDQVRVSVDDPPVFLHRTRALFEQVQPRTDDVGQAIAVLAYVANTEWYGAIPVTVATTIRYFIENGPPVRSSGITYRPLDGRLARLAAEAHPQIAGRISESTFGRDDIGYAADLVAALRFYRDVVSEAYYDNLFDAGLSDNPANFLALTVEQYEKIHPRTPDIDTAIQILRELSRSSRFTAYVALARAALGR